MPDINQNFSVIAGDDTEVLFDLGPDDTGLNLEFVDLTWAAYPQTFGVPDMTLPLISKTADNGILITDPLLLTLTVTLTAADTENLSGNYYHLIKLVAEDGKITTTTTGLMTAIDLDVAPNVISFKSAFPDFAEVDDTLVQIALDSTAALVDESWGTSEVPAKSYLAAHVLSLAGSNSKSGTGGGTGGDTITQETIGQISIRTVTKSASDSKESGTLGQSSYGIAFGNLLAAQGFGIAIV